jgi:hypothetical protein
MFPIQHLTSSGDIGGSRPISLCADCATVYWDRGRLARNEREARTFSYNKTRLCRTSAGETPAVPVIDGLLQTGLSHSDAFRRREHKRRLCAYLPKLFRKRYDILTKNVRPLRLKPGSN